MGQQQLILLVLATIIVGLAIVVGIRAFNENAIKSNADAMTQDAVRIANNSKYGLSGEIQTSDVERGLAMARRIRSGTLSVAGARWFHVDSPFGGYKQSGVGRENGVQGFEEYLETKIIAVPSQE